VAQVNPPWLLESVHPHGLPNIIEFPFGGSDQAMLVRKEGMMR